MGGTRLEYALGERDTAVADPCLPGARDEPARLQPVHTAERAGLHGRAQAPQFFFYARHCRPEPGRGIQAT